MPAVTGAAKVTGARRVQGEIRQPDVFSPVKRLGLLIWFQTTALQQAGAKSLANQFAGERDASGASADDLFPGNSWKGLW
jgi:hypothetical protein